MATLASNQQWGTGPKIYFDFAYASYRDGSDMMYRVDITVHEIQGASFYGYPIKFDISLNGSTVASGASIKSDFPTQWKEYTWNSSWFRVSGVSSGSVSLGLSAYSANGSYRSGTWNYSLPVLAPPAPEPEPEPEPQASRISCPAGTLAQAATITVTKDKSYFTHTIVATCGQDSQTVCTKLKDTAVPWTPKLDFAAQATTSDKAQITLTCTTYSGNTQIGTPQTVTVYMGIPSDIVPSLGVTVSDPTGIQQATGSFLQELSQLRIVTKAAGAYGSTISNITVYTNPGGWSYGEDVTVGVFSEPGSVTYSVTVLDSRGRTATYSGSIYVRAYAPPMFSQIEARRCNADMTDAPAGGYGKAIFSVIVSNPSGAGNTADYTLRYRLGGGDWTEVSLASLKNNMTVANAQVIVPVGIATDTSAEVQIVVTDKWRSTASAVRTVPIGFCLLQTSKGGTGIAVGEQATEDDKFNVALPIEFKRPVRVSHQDGIQFKDGSGGAIYVPDEAPKNVNITADGDVCANGSPVVAVVASGTVGNVHWVKYSDGWQDIWASGTVTMDIDTYDSTCKLYRSRLMDLRQLAGTTNYPYEFTEAPAVFVQIYAVGALFYLTPEVLFESEYVAPEGCEPSFCATSPYSRTGVKCRICFHAHGRYK